MRTYEGELNWIYPRIVEEIMDKGEDTFPRGKVCREFNPVTISIHNPRRRVITSYGRPVNVSFALAEVLWILGGRDDVEMLQFYNSTIGDFSDDGERFNAAYGERIRNTFGHDQLEDMVQGLLLDNWTRQASLVIAHPPSDRSFEDDQTPRMVKDRACNVYSHAMIRDGRLNWMQVLRSNDALWGVPYNMIQWTNIMEWVASHVGVDMGVYTHIADSLHIYDYHFADARNIDIFDLYTELGAEHAPIIGSRDMYPVWILEEMIRKAGSNHEALDRAIEMVNEEEVEEYWMGVLWNLVGFALYKQGRDIEALQAWLEGPDQIYNMASIRFAHWNRWHKPEHSDLLGILQRNTSSNIFAWATDRPSA